MADDSIKNYLNTLIFVIIAKACIVGLLVLLIFDFGWNMSFLILTIVIGLTVIVTVALVDIYVIDKKIRAAQVAMAIAKPILDICPDYFVRTLNTDQESAANGNVLCAPQYSGSDGRYSYDFSQAFQGTMDLDAIKTPYKTMNDMCFGEQNNYKGISWTDLKGKCGVLDTYAGNT